MLNLFLLNFFGLCSLISLNLAFLILYSVFLIFLLVGLKNHRFHLGFLRIWSLVGVGVEKLFFFCDFADGKSEICTLVKNCLVGR